MTDVGVQYTSSTEGLNFITYIEKSDYEKDNIVKFSIVRGPNRFAVSDCLDKSYDVFKENWDIFILWIDGAPPKKEIDALKKKYVNMMPLYAIVGKKYILITKIISRQIYTLSARGCSVEGIMDLYLYEMGAVMTDGQITPLREFKGVKIPSVIWSVNPSYVAHIKPKMHGWFSRYTALCLEYVLTNYQYGVVVELGSWFGKSTGFILQKMRKGSKLYCFDKFQNIVLSPYKMDPPAKIDQFYLTTPRYETFCKNISPYLRDKKCYTVKHDVNDFLTITSANFVTPDVVFIDAVKNTDKLVRMVNAIFRCNRKAIIVGDDYVFDTVKKAVNILVKNKKLNNFITDDCFIMTFLPLDEHRLNALIQRKYFSPETHELYPYEAAYYHLTHKEYDKVIEVMKGHKFDINRAIKDWNYNTFYNYVIIQELNETSKSGIRKLREYIKKNYQPRPVANILGLDYRDYVNKDVFY